MMTFQLMSADKYDLIGYRWTTPLLAQPKSTKADELEK
ncbi:hypothetical protein FHX66_002834 [Clostridium saccharobutylicum]|nr:hypothetical protein [Clostridium saccharobutylicum]NSB68794.1 hypothetical protein [Clostridium saccharobutylicum]NSC02789.1 hypothetical protein [Clostridium saccharobutylicum]NSC11699.1 hypothetical protein [Clostridium saccharobutylicum]